MEMIYGVVSHNIIYLNVEIEKGDMSVFYFLLAYRYLVSMK